MKMSWQEQASVNNRFSSLLAVGDRVEKEGVSYEIIAEGNTHILAVNKSFKEGRDIFLAKEECIKLASK